MNKLFAGLILLFASVSPALAQNFTMPPPAGVFVGGYLVVANCGTPGATLVAGKPAFATMDTTGTLCTAGGGSGGTSYTVNYGSANSTKGTPSGFNDASGNFQPLLGDVTDGQWINVKASVLPSGAATSANQATEITALNTLNTTAGNPLAAGTNTIGNTGSDPSSGKATPAMAFLALPATTTTQIIALSGTKVTYVTLAKVLAGGTVNVTFKYGTGTNCGTGTTTLEGPYPLTAQAGYVEGNGAGPVMIVPSGQALCVTTDASVGGGVKLISQQF
jgi:hypothetical protein